MSGQINVLVVEDKEDDAEIMILELEASDFQVSWNRVESAAEFRSQLSPHMDVILSDYNLPQFKAPDALRILQETGYDVPFIVVTGSISEEIAVATIKQGATDYLLKDRLSRLGEAVRQAIEQRDLRRAQHEVEQNLIREQQEAERVRHEADLLRIELEKERELRELKSQFVSMLVHDFRNPLTIMQQWLHVISRSWGSMSAEEANEKIKTVVQQIKRLSRLIDDVLLVGQMEFAATQINREPVNLVAYCKEVFDDFAQTVDRGRYTLTFLADHPRIEVSIDRLVFRRAILNLLSNAVKYSPSGGMVDLSVALNEGGAVIAVSDRGIGIPPEDRKRIFDGFYRASNVGRIEGNGLGLAIVKLIVDVHSGKLDYQSEVNWGTTFTIELPHSSL